MSDAARSSAASDLSILTTVPADIPALGEELAARPMAGLEILDRRAMSTRELIGRVLGADGKVDVLLLNGSGRIDQLAAALLWRRRSRTAVVISDSTWKAGSSGPDRLANRLGLRAIDSPRVFYCVLSSAERDAFPRTWGVDPRRVHYTPFCYTHTRGDLAESAASDGSVFAGGDSMRDYAPLVEAAASIPARVILATTTASRPAGGYPANVEAGPIPHDTFVRLLRQAAVVVVPLSAGTERSAGQQTYLNAMVLGKVVVATDAPGVRDYVDDGDTGVVVPPGDADALAAAVSWALDPANLADVERMRARARTAARDRFSPMCHFEALLDVARSAVAGAVRSRQPEGHG